MSKHFAALYEMHERRVYSLCLRMTGNTAEAEDLAQEAFLQLFRKVSTFRGESAFSTWLHRLAVNVVLMHLRKKGLQQVSLDEVDSSQDEPVKRDYGANDRRLTGSVDRISLARAIDELPPGYRTVFVLHDIEGYEHNEIAEIMDCSVGNSKIATPQSTDETARLAPPEQGVYDSGAAGRSRSGRDPKVMGIWKRPIKKEPQHVTNLSWNCRPIWRAKTRPSFRLTLANARLAASSSRTLKRCGRRSARFPWKNPLPRFGQIFVPDWSKKERSLKGQSLELVPATGLPASPCSCCGLNLLGHSGCFVTLPKTYLEQRTTFGLNALPAKIPIRSMALIGDSDALEHVVHELEETFRAREASLSPDLKATYENSLNSLDVSIRECSDSLQREPDNSLAHEYLLAAYSQKAEVLSSALEFDEGR